MAFPCTVTVRIRNLAFGGEGVGEVVAQSPGNHLLGISAFVPFTAVGEHVTARVEEEKKNYIRASLLEVEQASPNRVTPECEYYSICGGCELQHISYEAQLSNKFDMIVGALRAARLPQNVIEAVQPVYPSTAYDYRRRVTLHVDRQGNVGFYRSQSRSVVPIMTCSIAVEEIRAMLPLCREFARSVSGKISSLLLEADEEGVVVVVKSPYALGDREKKTVLEQARKYFRDVSLVVGDEEVGGFGRSILKLPLNDSGSLMLHVPAGAFSQVNWRINQELIQHVVQHAEAGAQTDVLDLYAGAGNFSLPLARGGARVTAVESDQRLVALGRQNAQRISAGKRIEFYEGSVERFLKSRSTNRLPDTIIADPPRSGLGQVLRNLPQPRNRLLLVACHLPSFIRDVRGLVEDGWQVETIEPFDMFPQTTYVEILGVFSPPPAASGRRN